MFHLRATADMIGVLFIRSFERAEMVYLAMRSRGFDGTVRNRNQHRIAHADIVFLAAVLAFLVQISLLGNVG